MATIYNESETKVEFSNKSFGKKREEIYFTLMGEEKMYHITVKGDAQMELTLEESEVPTAEETA